MCLAGKIKKKVKMKSLKAIKHSKALRTLTKIKVFLINPTKQALLPLKSKSQKNMRI